jgi:tripartite-type tricarboxylate transporter receptor subunit TctC
MKRQFLKAGFACTLLAAAALAATGALAQENYPNKPIRVVVPYAAGGADTYIRPLQAALEKQHGMNWVIDIVVGAGGTIGANQVKRANPDGYTILFCGSGALTIAPVLQNMNLTLRDFAPILNLVTIPYVIAVRPDAPYRTAAAFIDYLKQNPGKLAYGSAGIGSAPHLAMEALANSVQSSLVHVPYNGIAASVPAALGGHIDVVIGAPSAIMPQVRAGRLVGIALTSRDRYPPAPEVPALAEAGVDVDVATHFGFLAPKGTPQAVVDKFAAAVRDAARDPAFSAAMATMQNRIDVLSAADFTKAVDAEAAAFAPVIARALKQ